MRIRLLLRTLQPQLERMRSARIDLWQQTEWQLMRAGQRHITSSDVLQQDIEITGNRIGAAFVNNECMQHPLVLRRQRDFSRQFAHQRTPTGTPPPLAVSLEKALPFRRCVGGEDVLWGSPASHPTP